mmetsp:Transcript_10433/g.29479  ORF Transcript_10433/g.29479 Transcript_10433/m.29479 type:complete len:390 (+) Transcript_10433:624-1793(+)
MGRLPASAAAGPALQRRARLVLVADRPVGVRDVVLPEEVEPGLRLAEVQRAVARGLAGPPLRREDRHAAVEGGAHPVPQELPVRGGVEVDRVRHVLPHHSVHGRLVHALGPVAGAAYDEVLRVLADHGDNRVMVHLDLSGPIYLQRLVPDLEHHVRVVPVLPGHVVEKTLRLLDVLACMMIVPVDDHVDACIDAGLDYGLDVLLLLRRVLQVAAHLHAHGRAHERGVEVVPQPLDDVPVPVLRHPLGPEHRHAPQAHGLPGFANDLVVVDPQPAVLLHQGGSRCGAHHILAGPVRVPVRDHRRLAGLARVDAGVDALDGEVVEPGGVGALRVGLARPLHVAALTIQPAHVVGLPVADNGRHAGGERPRELGHAVVGAEGYGQGAGAAAL